MYVQIYIRSRRGGKIGKWHWLLLWWCVEPGNIFTALLLPFVKAHSSKPKSFQLWPENLGRKCHIFEYFNFLSNGNGAQVLETWSDYIFISAGCCFIFLLRWSEESAGTTVKVSSLSLALKSPTNNVCIQRMKFLYVYESILLVYKVRTSFGTCIKNSSFHQCDLFVLEMRGQKCLSNFLLWIVFETHFYIWHLQHHHTNHAENIKKHIHSAKHRSDHDFYLHFSFVLPELLLSEGSPAMQTAISQVMCCNFA